MTKRGEAAFLVGFYGGILAFILTVWAVTSNFEARAFERVTGKRISTMDAMFLDLRVQEPVTTPPVAAPIDTVWLPRCCPDTTQAWDI